MSNSNFNVFSFSFPNRNNWEKSPVKKVPIVLSKQKNTKKMYCVCTGIYTCAFAYDKPDMKSNRMLEIPDHNFITIVDDIGNFYKTKEGYYVVKELKNKYSSIKWFNEPTTKSEKGKIYQKGGIKAEHHFFDILEDNGWVVERCQTGEYYADGIISKGNKYYIVQIKSKVAGSKYETELDEKHHNGLIEYAKLM